MSFQVRPVSTNIHSPNLEKVIKKPQWFKGHISFSSFFLHAHVTEFIEFKSTYNNSYNNLSSLCPPHVLEISFNQETVSYFNHTNTFPLF